MSSVAPPPGPVPREPAPVEEIAAWLITKPVMMDAVGAPSGITVVALATWLSGHSDMWLSYIMSR